MKILILCLIAAIDAQSSEYTCTRDVNIGSALQQGSLIASFKTIDRLLCLGACNRNPSCLSCSFNNDATTRDHNCYLYNRVFTSSDYSHANNVNWYSKKGLAHLSVTTATTTASTTVTATSSTTSTSTTQSNAIVSACNSTLLCYFRNTSIVSNFTRYNGTLLNVLYSTEMVIVNNTPVYFLINRINSVLIKMSDSWQYMAAKAVSTINELRMIKRANDRLYVSAYSGFYEMDYNFNITKSINDNGVYYHGIYHNASDNTFALAAYYGYRVDWINANLTVLGNINFETYQPLSVAGYGDSLYVSAFKTSNTVIYVIRNRLIINTLSISNTTRMEIWSIVFDDYGYMVLTFRGERKVELYHINGTTTGFKRTFSSDVHHVNFDINRRMMISTSDALYFFN